MYLPQSQSTVTAYQLRAVMTAHFLRASCARGISANFCSLIARKIHDTFSYLTVNCDFYVAPSSNDVSRGPVLCLFVASFGGVCVVVIYRKNRHAKSHPLKIPLTH